MRLWRAVAVIAAIMLVAVGCASSGDDESTSTTSAVSGPATSASPTTAAETSSPDTTEPELTDSFRGVTADAITIGVVIVDVGILGRDNGDVEAKWRAVIDDVNANGGVLGRRLEPVFDRYSPIEGVSTEEACIRHTEDEQVFAALGPLLSNLLCYTETNDTIFINSFGVSQEEYDRSTAVVVGPGATPTRSAGLGVDTLVAAGALDGTVALHASVDSADALEAYRAALDDAGIDVVAETESSTAGDNFVEIESEMRVLAEVWESAGADTVVAVGVGSGINAVAGLDGGSYQPTLVLTDASDLDPNLYRDLGYAVDALADAVALGSPSFEDLAATGAAGTAECIERFEAASGETVNIDPGDDATVNLNTTIWACQAVEIFTQVAESAGVDLTNDSFRAAAEGFGPIMVTANGQASLGVDKFDIGDDPPVVLTFDPSVDDFVPSG